MPHFYYAEAGCPSWELQKAPLQGHGFLHTGVHLLLICLKYSVLLPFLPKGLASEFHSWTHFQSPHLKLAPLGLHILQVHTSAWLSQVQGTHWVLALPLKASAPAKIFSVLQFVLKPGILVHQALSLSPPAQSLPPPHSPGSAPAPRPAAP